MKNLIRIHLALLFVLGVAVAPYSAFAIDGQIKIAQTASTTFPIVIDKPGSYVLTGNLVATTSNSNAIEIRVDNVTLDLNGFSIMGPGNYQNFAILAVNKNNITVMNGTVRDFHTGVRLENNLQNGSNYLVKNIMANGNAQGITVEGGGTITDCTASNGGTGIYCHKCSITNCTVKDNNAWGMGVSDSVVSNCTVIHNGWPGIEALNSIVTNCVANYNHYNGSDPSGAGIIARHSTITNCSAKGNYGNGISAYNGSRIEGNNLRDNTKYGLYLMQNQNYAIKNAGSNNASGNFQADFPSSNYMPTSLTGLDAANANIGW